MTITTTVERRASSYRPSCSCRAVTSVAGNDSQAFLSVSVTRVTVVAVAVRQSAAVGEMP